MDGSSTRYEWSPRNGFYKFGLRHRLMDENEPIYGPAIPLFLNKHADELHRIFKKEKLFRGAQSITVYGEFFGDGSFAGSHLPDKKYDVVMFDVNVHKKGFVSPKEFHDVFGGMPVAELVYVGNLNQEFIKSVQDGTFSIESKYPVKTRIPEGIVAKIGSGHHLKMFKIKTQAYREELKRVYTDQWTQFWERNHAKKTFNHRNVDCTKILSRIYVLLYHCFWISRLVFV
jgi:hypothetical protein